MVSTLTFASLPLAPATALIAAGVIGVLGAGVRRAHRPTERVRSAPTNHTSGEHPSVLTSGGDLAPAGDGTETSPLQASLDLLDAWASQPRSAWRRLAEELMGQSTARRDERASARLILEGILAHHAKATDAWLIRDLTDTAWQVAPDDGFSLSCESESLVRTAMADAALAVLVQAWLPTRDFVALTTGRIA